MVKVNYKYDVISIGDATLDTFLKIDDATVLCNIKKDKCWLCLNYADKIPVTSLHHSLGGNASNLVVGASRLGLSASIYTIVGSDETGDRVVERFKKENVDLGYVKILKRKNTNYSVVINFQSHRTILGFHEKRVYKLPKLSPARYCYLTSMNKGCESVYPQVLKYIQKNNSKLCFGPGTYQKKTGFKVLEKIINNTYLFISNKEEAEMIFGCKGVKGQSEKNKIKSLLHKVRRHGPEIVVITDGPKGAYAHMGKYYYHIPIIDVPVVESTGAGDSFSTGVIAALACGKNLEEALVWGTFNSTSVIQYIGAQTGLMNLKKLKAFKRKYLGIKPKRI